LMNLFVNARHAMPMGGTLTVKTENIMLDEEFLKGFPDAKAGEYIELSISDTGIGMPQDVKDRMFEPFFTTKEDGLGTGLGLSTVYGIIKQHNGIVQVESEPEKGTAFNIYLPAVERDSEKPDIEYNNVALKGTETVLVVEDSPDVLLFFINVLKSLGYNVLSAQNSEEAIEASNNHKDKIYLLLTDVVMTGMNGYELYEQLKQERPDIKVLFLSGFIENPVVLNKIQKYKMPFLRKPVDQIKLSQKIREVLSG